jgi:hypothetical protein
MSSAEDAEQGSHRRIFVGMLTASSTFARWRPSGALPISLSMAATPGLFRSEGANALGLTARTRLGTILHSYLDYTKLT